MDPTKRKRNHPMTIITERLNELTAGKIELDTETTK